MATNIVDRFRTATGPSSRHRKGRSSSECSHKSDGVTPSPSRSPAVRIFHLNDMGSDESPPLQKTPRDQVEDEDSDAPGSLGRAWRWKCVNIGSPLPGAIIQAKSFYDFVGVIGEYVFSLQRATAGNIIIVHFCCLTILVPFSEEAYAEECYTSQNRRRLPVLAR